MSKNIIVSDDAYGVLKRMADLDGVGVYDEVDHLIGSLAKFGQSFKDFIEKEKAKRRDQDGRE